MKATHVLLVFGGESSEHEVSLKSARNVYAALDDTRYDVSLCFIDKVGRWWLAEDIDGHYVGRPQLLPELGQGVFSIGSGGSTLEPDVLFPVLHGANGEDGTVQGLARLMHIPCVGPSLLGAAVTMQKDITKRLLRDAGVPVVPWRIVHRSDKRPHFSDITNEFGMPIFIKPASSGSSIGVNQVTTVAEFTAALTEAFQHDSIALIEQGIDAREIEMAVLGNDTPKVSGAGEILPGDTFYSYDDKYAASSTANVRVPAELDDSTVTKLQEYALRAYQATGGYGMARIDFFIDKKTGQIYLNEINSIPGFTNISMYPKLWHAAGVSYAVLVDELIRLALEAHV